MQTAPSGSVFPLLAALGVVAPGCATPSAAQPGAPSASTEVRVVSATSRELARPVHATGTLVERDEVRLGFELGGEIATLRAVEGATFTRGATLAVLDARVSNAQARAARAAVTKAQRDLARATTLRDRGTLADAPFEDARTAVDVANAQWNAAEVAVGHARLIAPFDGVVLRELTQQGEVVAPGQPVFVVARHGDGPIVRAMVSDRDVVRLRVGDTAEVSIDALAGTVLQGRIDAIARAATARTGLFEIEVGLGEDAPRHHGLVARITVTPSDAAPKVVVPLTAVARADGARAWLYVVERGHALERIVDVAFMTSEHLAVDRGLLAGEAVIASGVDRLRDGERVVALAADTHEAAR